MMPVLPETLHTLRASPVFAFYVLVTVGLAGFIGLMFAQMALGLDFFLPGQFGQMAHGTVGSHRVHDVTFGLLVTTDIVGLLAQLQRPSKNVAGMLMALIPFTGLLLAAVLVDAGVIIARLDQDAGILRRSPLYLIAAVTLVAALLHPAGRDFFRSFRVSRVNWVMLVLVGIAAVPLLSYASTNIRLQQGNAFDEHGVLGHYAFVAALSFTVIGVGLLASLRPDGWRLTAWVTGLLPALLGLTSVIYPDVSSSLDLVWALAAIAWGIAFIAVAELTRDAEGLILFGSRGILSRWARG
ncbi:MAG: hypothetical protein GEU28_12225 [Dehalococcoidia bacterium]|nr:hypothetical protein [Dehalococcoidia bacterium]